MAQPVIFPIACEEFELPDRLVRVHRPKGRPSKGLVIDVLREKSAAMFDDPLVRVLRLIHHS